MACQHLFYIDVITTDKLRPAEQLQSRNQQDISVIKYNHVQRARKIINTTLRRRSFSRLPLLLLTILPPHRLHDFLLRAASRQALLHVREMLLNKARIPANFAAGNSTSPRNRLDLQQLPPAASARMPQWIDALRVALELRPAAFGAAAPDVLVVDLVAVLGGDVHAARSESRRALAAPGFEGGAVRLVFDAGDHEVG